MPIREKPKNEGDIYLPPQMGKPPEDLVLEQNGHLYIFGEILPYTTSDQIKALHRMWMDKTIDTVYVHINSPGGYVTDAFAIYDTLQMVQEEKPVITSAIGDVSSAAVIVLQGGSVRTMARNAVMMVHESWYEAGGSISQHEDSLKGSKTMDKIAFDILLKGVQDKAVLKELIDRKETYLTAKKAKRLGLIDKII